MKKLAMIVAFFSVILSSQVNAADIEAKYGKACATCHGAGVLGAPKKGDESCLATALKTRHGCFTVPRQKWL